jgi:hypothetical protein
MVGSFFFSFLFSIFLHFFFEEFCFLFAICTEWRQELAPELNYNDFELEEAIIFGFQVALFLKEIAALADGTTHLLAQFHEWMCGIPIILLSRWQTQIATGDSPNPFLMFFLMIFG